MQQELIGTWVEIELVNGKKWIGKLEEWDEDVIFISNGYEYGHQNHKGAECTNGEVSKVLLTDQREFFVK